MKPDNCPHCNVSLQGHAIPERHLSAFNAQDAKPGDEGWVTHFRREIGVEVSGVYDGVLFWQCPDCHQTWHRWKTGSGLWARAEREMARREGR